MDINLSIGRILLLAYILIASNYCSNLFSKGLKKAIESNKYIQHLILIVLIMVLIIIFGNPFGLDLTVNYSFNIIIMTLVVYIWFILTTKLDATWSIGIIILLAIYFIYESKKITDLKLIIDDPNLDNDKKKEIIDSFESIKNYFLVGIFGVTLLGTFFYVDEKQIQYGGGFNILDFWFN